MNITILCIEKKALKILIYIIMSRREKFVVYIIILIHIFYKIYVWTTDYLKFYTVTFGNPLLSRMFRIQKRLP